MGQSTLSGCVTFFFLILLLFIFFFGGRGNE